MHPRQKAILELLKANPKTTYERIQVEAKIPSLSTVKYHIGKLVKNGHIRIIERKVEVLADKAEKPLDETVSPFTNT